MKLLQIEKKEEREKGYPCTYKEEKCPQRSEKEVFGSTVVQSACFHTMVIHRVLSRIRNSRHQVRPLTGLQLF